MIRGTVQLAALVFCTSAYAAQTGEAIFTENCAMCHQANGEGSAGVAPPLAGMLARFTQTADGKNYLSQILISGMVGPIESKGQKIAGLMPSFADKLSDSDISAVLSYVLGKFNGVTAAIVQPQDVAAARAKNPSATDTRHLRAKLLAAK
jgi:mono/diheme cytochrome c family protein